MTMAECRGASVPGQAVIRIEKAHQINENEESAARIEEAQVARAVAQCHLEFAVYIDRRGIIDYSKQ